MLQMAFKEALMDTLTIRPAHPSDTHALEQLAALDSSRPLHEPVLVGEVGGELWAAVSMHDYAVVSDPFRPSGELAFVLVDRARRLERAERRRRRRNRRLPRLRPAA
jgi:hypothetical protein